MTGSANPPAEHVKVAIAQIDDRIAALNASIDEMRKEVDRLADARVQLDQVHATLGGAPTAKPQSRKKSVQSTRKKAVQSAKRSGSKYDLAEVARIARAAAEAGKPMGRAVYEAIPECPSVSAGGFLLSQARNAGHDVPGGRDAARKAASITAPATSSKPGPRNTPFVRPDASAVAELEREAGLA